MNDNAVVVLSGGQDSTTCLYWALERFGADKVSALTFDYGQRHRIELQCAADVAKHAGVPHTVLPIDTFAALGNSALTDEAVAVAATDREGLPATFVPGRNLVFLTFAAAYCWPRRVRHIVTGVAQTDYSGYPDCRNETIESLARTLELGMEYDFVIHTPLMDLSKAETVLLAGELGALPAMALTHTCYEGRRPPCGECQACRLRAKGFAEAGIDDPLLGA
jgi:7-cyano-7-deazaguanine synthase